MRTLKMSIVIVATFIVCWTPYYLLGLWYWFSPEMLTREKVPPSLSHILFLFGLFHTCLDPLVYGLFTARCHRGRHRREVAGAFTGSFRASAVAARGGSSPEGAEKCELEVTVVPVPAGRSLELCRGAAERGGPPGSRSALNPDGLGPEDG